MSTYAAFGFSTDAADVAAAFKDRVKDRHFVVTGANCGLGLECSRVLAKEGGIVYSLCRDMQKAEDAKKSILKELPEAKLTIVQCDLGSLKSIEECAKKLIDSGNPIHVLINNAGIMACPYGLTTDGFEKQFGTNHIGHFYLTKLLMPILEKSGTTTDPARVVNLSSCAHALFGPPQGILFSDLDAKKHYNTWTRYGMSKLANLLFTVDMQKQNDGKTVAFVALHPGVITTNLERDIGCSAYFAICGGYRSGNKAGLKSLSKRKTIPQGSATTILCALDPKIEFGKYYSDCQLSDEVHDRAFDEDLAAELTRVTDKLIETAIKSRM